MKENYKNKYLNSIALDAYEEYLKAIEEGVVHYESFVGDNEGFLYVKKNEKGYGIRISYNAENPYLDKQVLDLIQPCLDEVQEETYILINTRHSDLIQYFYNHDFKLVYPSFNMRLYREDWNNETGNIPLIPYENSHSEEYLELLGEAFVPIRKKLSLEPYNWYMNNQESSLKGFEESALKGDLFGYFVENELVGVLEVIDNDLELIAVKQSKQGKGYGGKLLQKGMEMVFSNKEYDTMTLGALQGNDDAMNLYKKHGFRVVATQTILKRTR